MRIPIVSDIHGNLTAFEAVLQDAQHDGRIDALWCLGDTVGYGPKPDECVALLRQHAHVGVVGNHDMAACGRMGTEEFNEAAAEAARWTERALTEGSRSYLAGLPQVATEELFTMVHGSLRWPEWEYLLSGEQAVAHFGLQRTPYSLVGHSHLPFTCREREGAVPKLRPAESGERIELGTDRLIVNPGSVGQPRDGDPRASYAVYDSGAGAITFRRVDYDIAETQRAMEDAGLPRWLSERLTLGR